jgi:putative tryptophan/tyrosine transport system substrate-binding protein
MQALREVCIKRREVIAALALVAAWPLTGRAGRTEATPVVAVLTNSSRAASPFAARAAFEQGVHEIAGDNVTVERYGADGQVERLPGMAVDLVRRQPSVIVTLGFATTKAVRATETKIPIVFMMSDDPVETGVARSLNKPGGNVTGIMLRTGTLPTKLLELLHELVPAAKVIALLVNPVNAAGKPDAATVHAAARTMGLQATSIWVSTESDLDRLVETLRAARADALLINPDVFFFGQLRKIVGMAALASIPTMYYDRAYVDAGGLISYGSNVNDAMRQTGRYAGRILKGENPADLPIMQPVKFELVINLWTAKVLGLDIPDKLLTIADEVIE